MIRMEFTTDWVQLTETDGAWKLESSFNTDDGSYDYQAAINGFESTILALAPHVNFNNPQIQHALQEALDAIDNRYA